MKSRTFLAEIAAAIIVATMFSAVAFGQTTPKPVSAPAPAPRAAAPAAVVSNSLPVSDKGTFRILLSGAEVGTEQFEISAAGDARILRSETVYRVPGSVETRSSGELRVSADGAPLAYKWTAQAGKKTSGIVEFKEGTAKNSVDLGDGKDPYQLDFVFPSPRIAILDNNLNCQFAILALLYDWSTKGQQTFPVLSPQDMTPGTISIESLGTKTVEGAMLEALRVNTPDAEIVAYFDARRRLMRVEVPAAMAAIVRR